MKKLYFLSALCVAFTTKSSAQTFFTDDLESYTVGSTIYQDWWEDWGCGGACALFSSDTYAHDGTKSAYVPANTGTGVVDAVLDLGNQIFGELGLEFYMYIPAGKEGYFNFQGVTPVTSGTFPVGNIFFNEDSAAPGQGYVDFGTSDPTIHRTFTYPEDQWFQVRVNFDFLLGPGASTFQMWIDGVEAVEEGHPFASSDGAGGWDYTDTQGLGGVDFYSISANNEYWVDSVIYQNQPFPDPTLSVSDFDAKGFKAYPNPVQNVLNLKANEAISNVAIFNVLGQEVYSAKINAMTSQVDMSQMASGAYFVKVNIGGTEGTVKVIK